MKLKEIVKDTALYLGRTDIVNYLSQNNGTLSGDMSSVIDIITKCANIIINELASTYLPMIKRETVNVTDNKVMFSDLTESVLEINKVYDTESNALSYSLNYEYLSVKRDTVTVEYKYLPPNYNLTDEIGYTEKDISVSLIAFGVTAEVLLIEKSFDESVCFRKRFLEALSEKYMPKSFQTAERRWE